MNARSSCIAVVLLALGTLHTARAQTCTPIWSDEFPIGLNGVVHASIVHTPSGNTPHLYVGGNFLTADGVTARRVASWNGIYWAPLGQGIVSGATVFAFAEFDPDGDGPEPTSLIVAGNFTKAGLMSVNNVARWDGTTWWALDLGVNGTVYTLATYDPDDDGPAPTALYAGGLFTAASGVSANYVARWDGTTWTGAGEGFNDYVYDLQVFDDRATTGNTGPSLYAAGGFVVSDGSDMLYIARWDGTTWSPLKTGPTEFGLNRPAYAMTVADLDGSGPQSAALYVGGDFTVAGSVPASRVVKWTGSQWQALGSGVNNRVYALQEYDVDGSGATPPALYAGGSFTAAGAVAVARIASWNGSSWAALGTGLNNTPRTMVAYDDLPSESEPAPLYVGGEFTAAGLLPTNHVARWGCAPSDAPPRIIIAPTDQEVCPGTTVTLQVYATGTPPLQHQWYLDGEAIPAATASSYTISFMNAEAQGVYTVTVTNDIASVTSPPAVVSLGQTPHIVTQPDDAEVCEGSSATFAVTAGGTGPLDYQWYHDGQVLFGASSPSLTVNDITFASTGIYTCRVTGACGDVESDPAWLLLSEGPEILESPVDAVVCAGDEVQLCVMVDPHGETVHYRWYKDDAPLPGAADSRCLTLGDAQPADSGVYVVEIDSSCGIIFSNTATVTVGTTPEILTAPAPQTACVGGSATFTVAVNGAGPLSYAWQVNGLAAGTDAATLVLTDLAAGDDGALVTCTVTSTCGDVSTEPAMLTVHAVPIIVTEPQSQEVCTGGDVSFCVTLDYAGDDVTYVWRKDGTPLPAAPDDNCLALSAVTADAAGLYDVQITTVCGTMASAAAALTVAELPQIAVSPADQTVCDGTPAEFCVTLVASDDSPTFRWLHNDVAIAGAPNDPCLRLTAVVPADAGTYAVEVTNSCGTVTSAAATLSLLEPPAFNTQPQGLDLCRGGSGDLCATLVPDGQSVTYTWFRDDEPLAGGPDGPCLSIVSATPADAGTYKVAATNACGTTTSDAATVAVAIPPTILTPPESRAACAGDSPTFSVTADGTAPLHYAWRVNGAAAGLDAPQLTLANVTLDLDGVLVDCTVSNVCDSVLSTAATLSVGVGPAIVTHPADATICAGAGVSFNITVTEPGAAQFTWYRDGVALDEHADTLVLPTTTLADDGATFTCVVTSACGDVASNTALLTVLGTPLIETSPANTAACAGGSATFTIQVQRPEIAHYAWFRDSEPLGADAAEFTLHDLTADDDGAAITCTVSNGCDTVTSAPAYLTIDTAPTITTQPLAQTACAGDSATFTIVAAGSAPLHYAWERDGTAVGDDRDTLTLADVQPADDGAAIRCRVSNSCGEVLSAAAVLAMHATATIVTPPANQTVCPGAAAQFCVTVAEPAAVTDYRWLKDGTPLADAPSDACYALAAATADDAGEYRVEITTACGTITSSAATLTLADCAPPAAPTSPSPANGATDQPRTLTLGWAAAAGADTYEVYFGTATSSPRVGTTTTPRWTVTGLNYATTYVWHVVAKNAHGDTSGATWSFRTAALPDNPTDPNGTTDPNTPTDPNDPGQSGQDPPSDDPNDTTDPNVVDPNQPGPPGAALCPLFSATLLTLTSVGLYATRRRRHAGTR